MRLARCVIEQSFFSWKTIYLFINTVAWVCESFERANWLWLDGVTRKIGLTLASIAG